MKLDELYATWENDDKDRYFATRPWITDDDRQIIWIRDGGNGIWRESRRMTQGEAIDAGFNPLKDLVSADAP